MMEYTVGSLADMISGSNSNKIIGTKKENSGVKIEYQKLPAAPLPRKKKESKKRKLKEDTVTIAKKKKKVRIILPTDDYVNEERDVGIGEADNGNLGNETESSGVQIATLESSENSNAKHARKRLKKKGVAVDEVEKNVRRELDPEQEIRTIFVGNLSNQMTKFNLTNIFRKFGKVESVRLRCAAVADPKTSKKVAVMRKEFHPERTNINGYVRFETAESAKKALAFNGTVVKDHTLRVDLAGGGRQYNPKNAVFVGNIQFSIEEEELHRLFEPCGKIDSIRLIRDSATSMGKGFAYVNFEDSQSVELALKFDGEELGKRPLRVSRCHKKAKGSVKVNNNDNKNGTGKDGEVKKAKKKKKRPEPGTEFQGQEVINGKVKKAKKKKKKKNKGEQQKMAMLDKLNITPKAKVKKLKIKKSKKKVE